MPQQIAVAFALCAFAVAIGSGLASGVAPTAVLGRALVVLIVSYAIGRALGAVLGVAMNEHLTSVMTVTPIPEPIRVTGTIDAGEGDVEIIDDVESL